MSSSSLLNTPILWINQYLQDKLGEEFSPNIPGQPGGNVIPFFPSGPSTIEQLTSEFVQEVGVMAVWDRMFRLRRGPFPHIRSEQVLYYFYSTGDDPQLKMIRIQEAVLRLLDRGDESAEELNQWSEGRTVTINGEEISSSFYFHDIRIYHLEESRDIVDFGTARTYAANKIIIEYKYHQMPELMP